MPVTIVYHQGFGGRADAAARMLAETGTEYEIVMEPHMATLR